jgi:hypothetical protein
MTSRRKIHVSKTFARCVTEWRLTGVLLLSSEELVNLLANLTVRDLNIILGFTIIGHQGKKTIVRNVELGKGPCQQSSISFASKSSHQLIFLAGDVGDIHVVGGGAKFFKLLAGEDVDGDEMDLGVAVLASLGSRHIDDLARTVLDHNEAVLPQGRALHGEGGRGAGIGGLEGVLMLCESQFALFQNAV